MTIWNRLVGQATATAALQRAVADAHNPGTGSSAMTHAWLLTGPPGAGRSTAAILFAAALSCSAGGCGECAECREVLSDTHPDVMRFIPQQITITRDEAEALIREASLMPSRGGYRIVIIEDADRLSEVSANMLLKSIEEPSARTVWLLCTPSADDVLPTIRSRCRLLPLMTPPWREVAQLLMSENVDAAMASYAARASQGHVGRARGLATDAATRERRFAIMRIPSQLTDLGACFVAAKEIVSVATEEANAEMDIKDAQERQQLLDAYGVDGSAKAKAERAARGAIKDLETRQKSRRTRAVRDRLDQALVDLLSYYRDVLVLQIGDDSIELINEDLRSKLMTLAIASTPTKTRNRMESIERARRMFASNAQPQMILESLTIELARA
jgi:DNA polymerase-3 subunit delta'